MKTTRTITAALGLSFGLIGAIGCGGGAETARRLPPQRLPSPPYQPLRRERPSPNRQCVT